MAGCPCGGRVTLPRDAAAVPPGAATAPLLASTIKLKANGRANPMGSLFEYLILRRISPSSRSVKGLGQKTISGAPISPLV